MIPASAPTAEMIIPAHNKTDCEKSPLIIVPSTRLPKLNLVISRTSLPKLRNKVRSLFGLFSIPLLWHFSPQLTRGQRTQKGKKRGGRGKKFTTEYTELHGEGKNFSRNPSRPPTRAHGCPSLFPLRGINFGVCPRRRFQIDGLPYRGYTTLTSHWCGGKRDAGKRLVFHLWSSFLKNHIRRENSKIDV